MAIKEVGGAKGCAELGVATHGPGCVSSQHVDLAGLQGGEPLGGVKGNVTNLVSVAKGRCGHGAAVVNVKAHPFSVTAGNAEAAKTGIDSTGKLPFRLNGVKGFIGKGGRGGYGKPHAKTKPEKVTFDHGFELLRKLINSRLNPPF